MGLRAVRATTHGVRRIWAAFTRITWGLGNYFFLFWLSDTEVGIPQCRSERMTASICGSRYGFITPSPLRRQLRWLIQGRGIEMRNLGIQDQRLHQSW